MSQPLGSMHTKDEPFQGWKVLTVINGRLHSPQWEGIVWKPYEHMVATCSSRAHESRLEGRPPHDRCSCGIYATKQLERELANYVKEAKPSEGMYPAVVQINLWGRVIPAATGFRAEKAYPAMIYAPTAELCQVLSENYGVPALSEPWKDIAETINSYRMAVEQGKQPVVVDEEVKKKFAGMTLEERLKWLNLAKYQEAYHRWYNRKKTVEKNIVSWELMVKRAPVELARAKAELVKLMASKPVRQQP